MQDEHTRDKPWFGAERRSGTDRRKASDRREEVRFEPAREQRRSGRDRRKQQGWDGTLVR